MNYSTTEVPTGNKIVMLDGELNVPSNPIVPFVEGDGIGPDIWRASRRILDSAVSIAYGDQRKISWMEVFAGQKAFDRFDGKRGWPPPYVLTKGPSEAILNKT